MSKFCGVLSSTQGNWINDEPLVYSNFETFANWIYNETEEMHSDFKTKTFAVQEQQEQSLENERNILAIDQKLKNLNDNVVTLEMGVQENDDHLMLLEKMLEVLESKQLEATNISSKKMPYDSLTDLLEKTDTAIEYLRHLVVDIDELEQYLQLQINPYNTVTNILDCHINILQQTEKSIDTLIDKTAKVEQIQEKILLASLSTADPA